MTTDRSLDYLIGLVRELCKLPHETQWVEFKHNNADPQEIGEYLSALANSAALCGKAFAYLVWGIADEAHDVIGTTFSPAQTKVGNEELENWLLRLLTPKIHFQFHEFEMDGQRVVLLEIARSFRHPVQFQGQEFIRVGSYTKKLKDFAEKERELWRIFDQTPYENLVAVEELASDEVLRLLDYPAYFDLLKLPLPETTELYQLPAPAFEVVAENIRAVLFAYRPLAKMDKDDRVRACYLHACLRYVSRNFMTNTSLRERFGIDVRNSAIASRLIKEALEAGVIRPYEEGAARKLMKYVPIWA